MTAAALAFARSSARPRRFMFDSVLLLAVAALLLLGLVMMTSASVSIADRQVHEPLHYLAGFVSGYLFPELSLVQTTEFFDGLVPH